MPHVVSGKWCAATVREICLDPINAGLQEYGRRSEGAHRRLGSDGPRLLLDSDRDRDDKLRTFMNDASVKIVANAKSEAFFLSGNSRNCSGRSPSVASTSAASQESKIQLATRCLAESLTDRRLRRRHVRENPRGAALVVCGRYMRTEGVQCENNAVDGKDFIRFLSIARGSVAELRTQSYIACKIGVLTTDELTPLVTELKEISRMLTGLARSINQRRN